MRDEPVQIVGGQFCLAFLPLKVSRCWRDFDWQVTSEPHGVSIGTAATIMNGLRFWIKSNLPTGTPAAQTPVDVLAIHEKFFVEQTKFLHGFCACEKKATDQHVGKNNPVVLEIEHVL